MSDNNQHESMPNWVIWAGVGMMVFVVLIFLIFTLSIMYWG